MKDYPIQVTAGDNHSCALSRGGKVKCWGDNDSGILGVPTYNGGTPVGNQSGEMGENLPLLYEGGVKKLFSGAVHNCVILTSETGDKLECWGRDFHRMLGLGNNPPTDFISEMQTMSLRILIKRLTLLI